MEFVERMRQSVGVKVAVIGFLTLIMLIPVARVESLVRERAARRDEALSEISSKWGTSQGIIGPILAIPYRSYIKDNEGKVSVRIETAYFLPDTLKIDGYLDASKRARGMFETVLYSAKLKVSADFQRPDMRDVGVDPADALFDQAVVAMRISDARGIRSVEARWAGRPIVIDPGTVRLGEHAAGVHARIHEGSTLGGHFDADMTIQGSSELVFAPVGKTNNVRITSAWANPSFSGAFLPSQRTVTGSGFSAEWDVSQYGRSVPHSWNSRANEAEGTGHLNTLAAAGFGTRLILPADFYLKADRALKYSLLFIGMTFLAFFLFEVFFRLRIHPFQYMLVGAALVLFYVVFLAISEHAGFLPAYLAAAACVVTLITLYSAKVLKNGKRAGFVGLFLSGVYSYLYVTLESQDYALILGAAVLFAGLGLVMYLTRNIDWYDLKLSRAS